MSLHGLLSVTIGVPNVEETAAYYTDFGLAPTGDSWFSTTDAGRQLRIVHAPTRRLVELRVAADDADDLARIAASLDRLGHPAELTETGLQTAEPVTGTPGGVGMARSPQRWLAPGDVLTSYIEGLGEMRHTFVAG